METMASTDLHTCLPPGATSHTMSHPPCLSRSPSWTGWAVTLSKTLPSLFATWVHPEVSVRVPLPPGRRSNPLSSFAALLRALKHVPMRDSSQVTYGTDRPPACLLLAPLI